MIEPGAQELTEEREQVTPSGPREQSLSRTCVTSIAHGAVKAQGSCLGGRVAR
jgi:hypothetical protein